MQDLIAYGQKTMTAKEIADALKVSLRTVQTISKNLFPQLIKNGVESRYNEEQVVMIKKQIGTGRNDLANICEVKDNVKTRLERLETIQKAMQILIEDNKELERQVLDSAPKVAAFDAFISSDSLIPVGEAAKVLGTGRNTLFRALRDAGVLMANNLPYQKHVEAGRFVVKETPVQMGEEVKVIAQTYFTTAGMDWWRQLSNAKALTA